MKQLAAANALTKENASLQGSFGRFGREMHQTADLSSSLKGLANPLICRGCRSSLGDLQPKLVVGPADDEYEREADRVAEQAVNMTEPPVQRACPSCEEEEPVQREPLAARITPLVQRQAAAEEEEEIQTKGRSGLIQREAAPEEEEELQTAPEVAGSKGGPAGPELEQSLEQARAGGRPLAEGFRGRMESAFGADFSSVRIHADEPADRLSRSIQARAFTKGQDIFLRQGEYQPATAGGQRLLAHELAHVVQQQQVCIRPIMQTMGGIHSIEDKGLEKEADVILGIASVRKPSARKTINDANPNATLQKIGNPLIASSYDIIQREKKVSGEFLEPTPTGILIAKGDPLKCTFEVKARFDLFDGNKEYRFGEYRQYIRGAFKSKNIVQDYWLFDKNMSQTEWNEDKTSTFVKYGYRSRSEGWFTKTENENFDRANGRYYHSTDTPEAKSEDDEMDLQFKGVLIDTGDNNKEIAERQWSIYGKKQ